MCKVRLKYMTSTGSQKSRLEEDIRGEYSSLLAGITAACSTSIRAGPQATTNTNAVRHWGIFAGRLENT